MILRKGMVCIVKDASGLDFCEEGEVCIFVDDVITVGAMLGTFHFRRKRSKVLNPNRIEIISEPMDYKVGDKVHLSFNGDSPYCNVIFTIQKVVGFRVYSVKGADLHFPVARHEIIPTTLGNRHSKGVLMRGD